MNATDLCDPWLDFQNSKGEPKLRFEVKGQEYFLAFVEQENRYYVFAPTPDGMQKMPVYVDALNWNVGASAQPRQLSS